MDTNGTLMGRVGGGEWWGRERIKGLRREDRFGRVEDNYWKKSTTVLQRTKYGYDRASNRQWRENVAAGGSNKQDDYYTYDGVYRLKEWDRGQLDGYHTGISGTPSEEEDFGYDETGNWKTYDWQEGSSSLSQTRTHNKSNEITNITNPSGVVDPVYDNAGNTTTVSKAKPDDWDVAYSLTWDGWNRLVKVEQGETEIGTYRYDGLNRRIKKTESGTTHEMYHDDSGRILEEYVGSNVKKRYYWGPRSRNDLVKRDRPDESSEQLYALHDLGKITALIDSGGSVVQRMAYSPYGDCRFLTSGWGSGSNGKDWNYLFRCQYCDDNTGLYRIGDRAFHPLLGRWLSRYPVLEMARINVYEYGLNSPLNWHDIIGTIPSNSLRRRSLTRNNQRPIGRVPIIVPVLYLPPKDPNTDKPIDEPIEPLFPPEEEEDIFDLIEKIEAEAQREEEEREREQEQMERARDASRHASERRIRCQRDPCNQGNQIHHGAEQSDQ